MGVVKKKQNQPKDISNKSKSINKRERNIKKKDNQMKNIIISSKPTLSISDSKKGKKSKIDKENPMKNKVTVENPGCFVKRQITDKVLKKPKQTKGSIKNVIREVEPKLEKITKTGKFVLPSNYVTDSLVTKAVDALFKLTEATKKTTKMFEEEAPIYMQINCIKIPNKKSNVTFQLRHCTAPSTGEICLITPDLKKGKRPDHEPTIEHWEDKLRNAQVTKIKTILPMRQLRVEYDQFELKRNLMTQHDLIMVDTRVLNHVSHLLGKNFFKKHNMLIPVRLENCKDLKSEIDKTLCKSRLRLNDGVKSCLIIGNLGMSQKEVKDNILAIVQQLESKYPGGERNIRSLEIKHSLSLALPIYWTLRSKKTITPPKLAVSKPSNSEILEDELSTLPNALVKVNPDGKVIVMRTATKDDLLDRDMIECDEEVEEDDIGHEEDDDNE